MDGLRVQAEDQRARDVVHVLRLAAQAAAAQGNGSREAPGGPGRLPARGDREEARDQPGDCEGHTASRTYLDGVQGVLIVGLQRS